MAQAYTTDITHKEKESKQKPRPSTGVSYMRLRCGYPIKKFLGGWVHVNGAVTLHVAQPRRRP